MLTLESFTVLVDCTSALQSHICYDDVHSKAASLAYCTVSPVLSMKDQTYLLEDYNLIWPLRVLDDLILESLWFVLLNILKDLVDD
jgi:hypothetical protein